MSSGSNLIGGGGSGSSGDIDTCPICYEDIDIEMEMIKMPNCNHKMHVGCYATYTRYCVDQYNRAVEITPGTSRLRGVSNEIGCPFCRKVVMRLDDGYGLEGAGAGAAGTRHYVIPMAFDFDRGAGAGAGAATHHVVEIAMEPRDRREFRFCSVMLCFCAVAWLFVYLKHMMLIYDGDGVTVGFVNDDYTGWNVGA